MSRMPLVLSGAQVPRFWRRVLQNPQRLFQEVGGLGMNLGQILMLSVALWALIVIADKLPRKAKKKESTQSHDKD